MAETGMSLEEIAKEFKMTRGGASALVKRALRNFYRKAPSQLKKEIQQFYTDRAPPGENGDPDVREN
jgi:transcriptional regulator